MLSKMTNHEQEAGGRYLVPVDSGAFVDAAHSSLPSTALPAGWSPGVATRAGMVGLEVGD
jgi:hypothetical protein